MNVIKLDVCKIPAGSIFNSLSEVKANSSAWVVQVPMNFGFYQVSDVSQIKGPPAIAFKSKSKAIAASKILNSVDGADKFRTSGQFEYSLVFYRNGVPFIFN